MPGGEPSSPASASGAEQQQQAALLRALQLQRDAYLHISQHQFDQPCCLSLVIFLLSTIRFWGVYLMRRAFSTAFRLVLLSQ